MGTDITSFTEVFDGSKWRAIGNAYVNNEHAPACIFDGGRNYSLFGFLADVQNRANSPIIGFPKGLPEDVSDAVRRYYFPDLDFCASWLTLEELLNYDYEQRFVPTDGLHQADLITVGGFLGEWYFERLEILRSLGDPDKVRIVFWFDC